MRIRLWYMMVVATGMHASAYAWNPNEGSDLYTTPAPRSAPTYSAPVYTYTPPAQAAAVQPSYTPPAPAVASAPVYAAPITPPVAPAYNIPTPDAMAPQPVAVAPVAVAASDMPPASAEPTANFAPASRGLIRNRYSLGLEGMYDNYEEPETFPDLHTDAYYGGITGSMTHYFTPRLFAMLDGRGSIGRSDYYSSQGHNNDSTQYEIDARILTGLDFSLSERDRLKPYFGFGTRYYFDNGKNTFTQAAAGYDRRIYQYYLPIGATYEHRTLGGLTVTPNIEVDPLIHGVVKSRLGELPGYSDARNEQDSGIGYRAQVLIGELDAQNRGWLFGPVFRYWDIDNSNIDTIQTPGGPTNAREPMNHRFQLGADLKYMF